MAACERRTTRPELLRVASLPYCTVVVPEPLDSGRGRLFAGYHARAGARWLLGQGVLDEFGTLSSPIWIAPADLIGSMYDFGIAFGFELDPELPIDGGWPPVCIGLDQPAPPLPPDWEGELAAAIRAAGPRPPGGGLERLRIDGYRLDRFRIGEAAVLETDAPLLPHQLRRLAEASAAACALAVSTAQRVTRSHGGEPARFAVASESVVDGLARGARQALGTAPMGAARDADAARRDLGRRDRHPDRHAP